MTYIILYIIYYIIHYASVGLSICHSNEPYKNGWTHRDAVWVDDARGPGSHVLIDWCSDPPWEGQFWGHKGRPIVSRITSSGKLTGYRYVRYWCKNALEWLFILLEGIASAEYYIHFGARSVGVQAFAYNSAESERIWVKYRALWVHCPELSYIADFGRDPCSSESRRARRNFVFSLSDKIRTILPIFRRLNFTKFEHNTSTNRSHKESFRKSILKIYP